MAELEEIVHGYRDVLTADLADAILAGWVSGANLSAGLAAGEIALPPVLPSIGAPPVVPPAPPAAITGPSSEPDDFPGLEQAIKALYDRNLVTPDEFYALSAAAKQQAFTISGDLSASTIERIHEILADNVAGAANRETFLRAVRDELGTLPISESHLEHVYRNAANEAYTQGQDHVLEHPLVADAFPYRAYFAIHDPRARHEHRDMEKLGIDGTNVFHKDDPTWLRFKPPWDWNCRCGWAPLSIRDAARLGVKEAQQWLETGIEPVHVWVAPPPFSPSPSWDLRVAV